MTSQFLVPAEVGGAAEGEMELPKSEMERLCLGWVW